MAYVITVNLPNTAWETARLRVLNAVMKAASDADVTVTFEADDFEQAYQAKMYLRTKAVYTKAQKKLTAANADFGTLVTL